MLPRGEDFEDNPDEPIVARLIEDEKLRSSFVPFAIRLADGRPLNVDSPYMVLLYERHLHYAGREGSWASVPYSAVLSVESVPGSLD